MFPVKRGNDLRVISDAFEDFFKAGFPILGEKDINISVKEEDGRYEVKAEIPGVQKEDIQIEYENNHLIINAKKEESHEVEEENYIYKEIKSGQISRAVYLPEVEMEKAEAEYVDGVLKMGIPKKEGNDRNNRILIDIK